MKVRTVSSEILAAKHLPEGVFRGACECINRLEILV